MRLPQRIPGPAHLPQGQKHTDGPPVFLMLNMLLSRLCWTSQAWGRILSEEGNSRRMVLKVLAAAVALEGTTAWMFHNFWLFLTAKLAVKVITFRSPLLRLVPVRTRMQSQANSAGSFDSTFDGWIRPFFPCLLSILPGIFIAWRESFMKRTIVESWVVILQQPSLVLQIWITSCSTVGF